MNRQRRKRSGALHRTGHAFAALHALNHAVERSGHDAIDHGLFADAQRFDQGNAVGDERCHGARESSGLRLAQQLPEQRDSQQPSIGALASGGSVQKPPEQYPSRYDGEQRDPSVTLHQPAGIEQQRGRGRHRQPGVLKNLRKPRHHKIHQHAERGDGHRGEQHRIDQR